MQPLSDRTASFTDSVIRRMTRISLRYDAVNLSQGFPDFDPPTKLLKSLEEISRDPSPRYHQYSITWGAQAMRQALAEGGFTPDDLGHLNAHGTSTHANDAMESAALKALVGEERAADVPVTSVKGSIGHTLGAAGALEAIVCALSVANDCVPPTAGTREIDPECGVNVPLEPIEGYKQKVALSNSLGFGGHNGSLAISPFAGK